MIAGDGFIHVKQILIVGEKDASSYDGSYFTPAEPHTDEEARRLLEEARVRYLAGADFDQLVASLGQSLYMIANPEGYYLCHGMWDDTNEQAAFSLVENEISQVVESEQGFSLFLRCEKDDAYIDAHLDEISESYAQAVFGLALEEKSASMQVETTELYDSISIRDLT